MKLLHLQAGKSRPVLCRSKSEEHRIGSPRGGARVQELARGSGFALLVLGILLGIGCASVRKNGLNSAETMILSTYPLASSKAFGTGFLVAMKDKQSPGGVVPVMVTSTHLVKSVGRGGLYMPLRGFDMAGNLSIGLLKVAPEGKDAPFYVKHPRLDVAAFRVQFPAGLQVPLLLTLLEEKNLQSEADSRAGDDVAFVGFPEGQSTSLGMFPVLRAGTVASLDQSLFGLRSFLINGDVYPGDSGGPVFRITKNGRPKVVGMVVERLSVQPQERFPLALAVDAQAIRETLQLLAARSQR